MPFHRGFAQQIERIEMDLLYSSVHHTPRSPAHRAAVRQRNILWANITNAQLAGYALAIQLGFSNRGVIGGIRLYSDTNYDLCLRQLQARRFRARRALHLPSS